MNKKIEKFYKTENKEILKQYGDEIGRIFGDLVYFMERKYEFNPPCGGVCCSLPMMLYLVQSEEFKYYFYQQYSKRQNEHDKLFFDYLKNKYPEGYDHNEKYSEGYIYANNKMLAEQEKEYLTNKKSQIKVL